VAITLVDSEAVGFADGSGGHVYTFPVGAPSVGDLDVLCINSNTTVSTPSGFTARVSAVANQGAYIFTRKASGGESSSVTITTSGDHNTTLTWSRWSGTEAYSDGNSAQANNSNGTALPAASTGTLAATNMLVIAFGALHNHDGALAASPSWINSFTALESVSQGAAASSASCVAFTGYKTNAGTTAETIDSVTWTNNARNRYALWIAVTAAAGGSTVTGTATANLGGITATAAGTRRTAGTAAANLGALTATALGDRTVYGTAAASLGALTATAAGTPTVKGVAAAALGALTATAAGLRTVYGAAVASLGGLTATATDGVEATGAGTRITASTPVGRIVTTTPGGRL
jgi:hypothetical protein